ncbi:FluG domain-containing protein [Metarhizium guizhouense ARSEF 977]|uniref:FluG domain-containing protein n=1 Tax=Metarhizium guizhouense (strain ARSEF 977) TaxID=1276136 RepID=A0A0B4GVK8_METGA|nr:FluG domain-containing protein [Metarhizium guizhouense ARSEF 977]
MDLEASRIEHYQQRLRQEETPEPEPWRPQELQNSWERGNRRRPLPSNHSDSHKVDLYRLQLRWKAFCHRLRRPQEWKVWIKTLTRGRRFMPKARLAYTQGSLVVYTKSILESRGTDLLEIVFANTADASSRENGACGENQKSSLLWADFCIYHIYFLWVRDTLHFHIGLDRLDDATIRHICMFSGCRKHELVYAKPKNLKELVKKLDEESDAYTDVEHESNECIPRRVKECWTCGRADERTNNRKLKDRLATQILLRWHKGENKQIVPTWHTFVEEDIPMLCLVSHILAKALSDGVIDNNGYQERADPFFRTKLNKPPIKIRWKREWLHRPVSRETVNALGKKSNDPATAAVFDSHSVRLGIALGLAEKMSQYGYHRGYANCVDCKVFISPVPYAQLSDRMLANYRQSVRDQGMRHRPNSTIYQEAYHNVKSNPAVQDAFLGRGTASPYLAIFNHVGLWRDENAPKLFRTTHAFHWSKQSRGRRLEEEVETIKAALPRTARQKHRRKVHKMIYKDHFDAKDEEELQKQSQGIQEPEVKL